MLRRPMQIGNRPRGYLPEKIACAAPSGAATRVTAGAAEFVKDLAAAFDRRGCRIPLLMLLEPRTPVRLTVQGKGQRGEEHGDKRHSDEHAKYRVEMMHRVLLSS